MVIVGCPDTGHSHQWLHKHPLVNLFASAVRNYHKFVGVVVVNCWMAGENSVVDLVVVVVGLDNHYASDILFFLKFGNIGIMVVDCMLNRCWHCMLVAVLVVLLKISA